MEIYEFHMLINVMAIVSSSIISYLYASKMIKKNGAFFFHTVVSLTIIVVTWFVTTSLWYYHTYHLDGLLYIGGMLFNMIFMMLTLIVYLAYLLVRRPYLMQKYKAKQKENPLSPL
ncbi:hypothetical protein [Sutcliffiella deserti]|uniref:hypothetical protein n=1 Tax=Sutcliffiella deserti TaxID=2875501 RepID=UPI001CBA86E7|nr:hypothetical protein [Sutcliffiella deserti]